jgi:hypothetical protein
MSPEHRVKIQNSNILNALIEHIEGRREMSSTQVSAGLGLLKKILPDMSAVTVTEEPDPVEKIDRIVIVAEPIAECTECMERERIGGAVEQKALMRPD